MNRRAMAIIALVAAFALLTPTSTLAAGSYSTASIGHDVSWPNCGSTLPAAGDFGIVGVTAGRAFSQNSCLVSEYAWAALTPSYASLYMNLNAPVGSTAQGNTSAPRACSKKDKLCQSYDYGWNSANAAYTYALTTLGATNVATTWWLDVETSNSWLSNLAANAQVVQGALDFLGTGNLAYNLLGRGFLVGVYSTNSMWSTITGGYHTVPLVPVWYATAVTNATSASGYCGSAYSFSGGPVWLVQFTGSGIDADYSC